MNCLLVDDEPGIREGLAAWLRRQGVDVRTAADCAQAREALATAAFDVVVTDWRLPDGLASSFLGAVAAPVLAVSGYPEEVERRAPLRAVLTKPIAPSRLLAAIREAAPAGAAAPDGSTAALAPARGAATAATAASLPVDVQDALACFRATLPPATACELDDDGTFVHAAANVPAAVARGIASEHGDLQVRTEGDGARVVLRLRRDGRPDGDVAVVAPDARWPAHGALAVDFHGSGADAERFAVHVARAVRARAAGQRVQFLNVPPALRSTGAGQGTPHDMPMRDAVGPRLPADLADLWSDP
jgi:CheY-like chemotaxis protein